MEEQARTLADCPRDQQDFVLHWASIVARTAYGLVVNFLTYVPAALRVMDMAGIEEWLLHCMDDYDTYRGAYGIEDTRQALIEARRDGIHSFCITIDTEAKDYLPHMYGAANYVVINEVKKLPLKVADIYRRLTT